MYAQTEIFPLKKGLHYKCNYRSYGATYELGYLTRSEIDSGIVQYIILDSTKVNDTTTTWRVFEKFYLMLRNHRTDFDTLFWKSDSSILTLTEITKGFHELKGNLLICNFPLLIPYSTNKN